MHDVEPQNPIQAMEAAWPKRDREKLARFLNIDADNEAFIPFLTIASELGLNPFTGEIWLIPQRNRVKNAQGRWEDGPPKYSPAVGRDGLLKSARRHPEYLGFKAGVHCEGDEFAIDYGTQDVHHVQRWDGKERGTILGAWCRVAMRNREPLLYYAPLREHGRYDTEKNRWQGAWDYLSGMILKSAVSYAHRLALGVSGVVPADELREGGGDLAELPEQTEDIGALIEELTPDLDDELRTELTAAVREANERTPFSWAPSKLRMRLGGKGAAAAKEVYEEVRDENQRAAPYEAEAAEETLPEAPGNGDGEEEQPEAA